MTDAPRRIEELLGPARNFKLAFEERLKAHIGGLPAFIRRRRLIEDLIERKLQELRDDRRAGATAAELRAKAESFDLSRINDLVDRHNRYYPIEANLPIDPRTGGPFDRAEPWRPIDPVTADTLLSKLT